MTEKPQEAQISLWKAVEGLEGQIATLEAENAALRAAQHGKGQGMPNDSNTQAVQQAEYIALDGYLMQINQLRGELLELKDLL